MTGQVAEVRTLAALVRRRPPLLAGTRLVLLEGRAGAGKTTLAAALATRLRRGGPLTGARQGRTSTAVTVLAMDDLYAGWDGLPGVGRELHEQVLRPLVDGGRARVRAWDWHAHRRARARVLPSADVLVVEGVGSWATPLARWVSLLVWVDAPTAQRRERALARDGDGFAPYWDAWAADEDRVHLREGTRSHADVVFRTP